VRHAALKFLNGILTPTGMRLLGPRDSLRFENGLPNPHELRRGLFRRMAKKGFKPNYIIDVGAHRGAWSRDARRVWPLADFTLIEPLADLGSDLDRFVAEGPTGRARWILAGCAANDGEMTFTALPGNPDAGTFRMTSEEAAASGGTQMNIPVKSLDTICGNHLKPDIIKIDAEGLDLDVLRGASQAVQSAEVVFIELPLFDYFKTQSLHGIMGSMREIGFEPYDITDMNRRPCDNALALIEVAFAKYQGILRDHHGW
jgi:FkbM family methyltransferase